MNRPLPELYTLDDVASRLRADPSTVKKLVKAHPELFKKAGRTVLIDKPSLVRLWHLAIGWNPDAPRYKAPAERKPVVYVIGFGPYVKIGRTGNFKDRLEKIQTHAPESIKVYALFEGSAEMEAELHKRFAFLRLKGEWFFNALELQEWIEEGCPP